MARVRKKARPLPKIPRGTIDGNSSVFLPDCLAQVKAVAWRGLSDDEIAANFGVDKDLFQNWKKMYPSFREAIEHGRTHADAEVVAGLYKRAIGYDYREDALDKRGDVHRLRRHAPPDVSAQKFWLTNRQREHWSDRHSLDGGGSRGGGTKPVAVATKAELIGKIFDMMPVQPDNEVKRKTERED